MDKKIKTRVTRVRNTTKETLDFPAGFLLDALVHGTSGAIERQEAEGQAQLVNSTQIPVKGIPDDSILEKLGFKLGEKPKEPKDDLFRDAELPEGWSKQATNHDLWSNIVDEKGRKRISIFFKAAFYDRDAFMSLIQRFTIQMNYDKKDKDGSIVFDVLDQDKADQHTEVNEPVFSSSVFIINVDRNHKDYWEKKNKADKDAQQMCKDWLAERYPEWEDATAHWEDE